MPPSNDVEALLLDADLALGQGDHEEAIKLLRAALTGGVALSATARKLAKELLDRLRPLVARRVLAELWDRLPEGEAKDYTVSSGPPTGGGRGPGKGDATAPPPTLALEATGPENSDKTEVLRRTPHLRRLGDDVLTPGTAFQAELWADQEAADAGAITEDIEVEAPSSQRQFRFRVFLVASSHFEIDGDRERELILDREEKSSARLRFDLRVVAAPPAGEPAYLSAIFLYQGRPSGSVKIAVALGAQPFSEQDAPGRIHTSTTAKVADLNVLIAAEGPLNWRCRVQSPLLESLKDGVEGPWHPGEQIGKIVLREMEAFMNGATPFHRSAGLKGAGRNFFNAAPQVFRDAYWSLVDAGKSPTSMALVSDEPYLPWELMMPSRRRADGGMERRAALGVEMAIGRWTRADFVAPAQQIKLRRGYVVCPTDSGLSEASDEAKLVLSTLPEGERVEPATAERLNQILEAQPPSLLHFVCHGISDDAQGGQQLTLEGHEAMTTSILQGLDGVLEGLQRGRPLVFLNACQVGRLQPDLVGPGGFAEVFMREGASAVVAALWSVEDKVASAIAATFYQELAQGHNLADILRRQRAKAYEGDALDTYAAYCFYGDPLAVGVLG